MRFDYILYYIVAFLDIARAVVSARFTSPTVIDLMEHVTGNLSGQAMKRIPGQNGHSTAHMFQGSNRLIEVTPSTVNRVRELLQVSEEFTLVTAIKQREKTSGSILSFYYASRDTRYFELESSGRRDELRLHYYHSGRLRSETFPYKLADNQWHTLALGFSRDYIEVFIDCKKIYERNIGWLDWSLGNRKMSLHIYVGQRSANHAYFKGAIEYIALIGEPHGVLHICPHANIACPTCSQFRDLQHSIAMLDEHIKRLNNKLLMAERRITELEQCDCQLSCSDNGTVYKNEETWHPKNCTTCVCNNGTIHCQAKECKALNCKFPVHVPGKCCPVCGNQCYSHGIYYDHGVTYSPSRRSDGPDASCFTCRCDNGSAMCSKVTCEEPKCPVEEQFQAEGECCRRCNGTNFCGQGNDCHVNATCINFVTAPKCECNRGFTGDGKRCEDIDECLRKIGEDNFHHCGSNTRCVNTIGSYKCECQPGYRKERTDHLDCEEHDECENGSHGCDINANCTNKIGGYSCQCQEGYEGDGYSCKARCRDGCRNGGVCVSPDVCQCRKGFGGRNCREEIDECELQMDRCHRSRSECVNVPGSYYCQCKKGFYSDYSDNHYGARCIDEDECSGWGGGHQCPEGTVCHNMPGGYECVCISPSVCGGCQDGNKWHRNGTSWRPSNSSCVTLSCINGHIHSRRIQCDCRDPDVDRNCCHHCRDEGQCMHHGANHLHGDQWLHQCQQCECLNSEVDCWPLECPRLSCNTIMLEGDCCPRCEDDFDPCSSVGDGTSDRGRERRTTCDVNVRDVKALISDQCTTCECKRGHVCCRYDQNCSRRKKFSRRRMKSLKRTRKRNSERARSRPNRRKFG